MKKRLTILLVTLCFFPLFGQKLQMDSLIYLAKYYYCQSYNIGHVRNIINGEKACLWELKNNKAIFQTINITKNKLDSIELFIVYDDSLSNVFETQFIPLNKYTGKYYTTCSIEEFNRISENDTNISLIDKSFIFLILNNVQYFHFYSMEKDNKTQFQYHLMERLYKPFHNYPVRVSKIGKKTTITIFLLYIKTKDTKNRGAIITKNKLYFHNNKLMKTNQNQFKKETKFKFIFY